MRKPSRRGVRRWCGQRVSARKGCALLIMGSLALLPAAAAGSRQQGEQRPGFGATVARVRVDVIVTDERGGFVDDLGIEDFRLFEDGAPQAIVDAQLVDLGAGRVEQLPAELRASPGKPIEPQVAGNAVATPASEDAAATPAVMPASIAGTATAAELGAIIFLIDGPSLTPEDKARFATSWEKLLERTGSLQVPRAAYLVDNAGRLEELAPLGADLASLEHAAERVEEAPLTRASMTDRLIELNQDLGSEDTEFTALGKARYFEAEERARSLGAYKLLTHFCDALWTRSGRTALVWVSAGVKLMTSGPYIALFAAKQEGNQPANDSPLSTFDQQGGALSAPRTQEFRFDLFSPDAQIRHSQQQLHRAANSANVSIYAVDPTPLSALRSIPRDARLQSGGSQSLLGSTLLRQSLDGLRDSQRNPAEATRGRAFIHAPDLPAAREEIERDTSRFYLLTYAPPEPEGDGDYHEIRVQVLRPGLQVRARSGYVDRPPAARRQRLVNAALSLPGTVTGLSLRAETFLSWSHADEATVLLAVAVDTAQLTMRLEKTGARSATLDVHAVVLDGDKISDQATEKLVARTGPAVATGAAGSDRPVLPRRPPGYVVYRHEWTLAPGSYDLRVAVIDSTSGRVGATRRALEIPEPPKGWATSEPLLVASDPSGATQPMVGGRALTGQTLRVFVEVYSGMQPILSGRVFSDSGEQTDPDASGAKVQSARLFPTPLRRTATNIHQGTLLLPTGLPTGDYILQVVITDPAAGRHKIFRLPFRVADPLPRYDAHPS
ncbi:MAG: VWA domain-containing protein [Acidobacteriota bacterium]